MTEIEKRRKEVEKAKILSRVDGTEELNTETAQWFEDYAEGKISYEELGEKIKKQLLNLAK